MSPPIGVTVVAVMLHLASASSASFLGLDAPAGEREEHVVEAGFADGEGRRREPLAVERPQRVDDHAGAVAHLESNLGAVDIGRPDRVIHQVTLGAARLTRVGEPDLDHGAAEPGLQLHR